MKNCETLPDTDMLVCGHMPFAPTPPQTKPHSTGKELSRSYIYYIKIQLTVLITHIESKYNLFMSHKKKNFPGNNKNSSDKPIISNHYSPVSIHSAACVHGKILQISVSLHVRLFLNRGKDDAASVVINSLCCLYTHTHRHTEGISKSLHTTVLGNPVAVSACLTCSAEKLQMQQRTDFICPIYIQTCAF